MLNDTAPSGVQTTKTPHVAVPDSVLYSNISSQAFVMYCRLAMIADRDGLVASIRKQELADSSGQSTRSVIRQIAELEDAGIVESISQYCDHGGRQGNAYRLVEWVKK